MIRIDLIVLVWLTMCAETSVRKLILLLLFLSGAASASNFVPNSGFECLYSRGWNCFATANSAQNADLQFHSSLITNDSRSGSYSMILPTQARLVSGAIYLLSGSYHMSWYGKGSGTLPFGIYRESDLASGAPPPNSAVLSGSWTRYECNFTAGSNALYYVRFGYGNALSQIDDIMVESGSSASTYEPQSPVEVGLSIPSTNNMWFSGDSPMFQLNLRNIGSTMGVPVLYDVYDVWGSNVLNGRVVVDARENTNTSTTVSLPSRTGWFRVTSRVPGYNNSYDEITTVIYPYSLLSAYNTTGWLGGHPNISYFYSDRERRALRGTGRALSPNNLNTWQTVQPSTNTDFNFTDSAVTNWNNNGLEIVAPLCAVQGTWNPWATNSDGTASMSFWSNYCYLIVNRVCNTLNLTNTWFELWNEPYQSGPSSGAIDVTQATNYARLMTYGIWGITNAYPSARIIAIGGSYGNGDWALEAYTNLSASSKAAVSVISTHYYPPDNFADPNDPVFEASYFSTMGPWIRIFTPLGKPVWVTEGGTYDTGPYLGLNGFWPDAYDIHDTPSPEAARNEIMQRQLVATIRQVTCTMRSIGYGMGRYFYYDCRAYNDSSYSGPQPYAPDYMQVDRPAVVALSIAANMVSKGFGMVTNAAAVPWLEAYAFTNSSGKPVIMAWNAGRTNMNMVVTNSNFETIDVMGNPVSTNVSIVRITRVPQYFRSGTMTLAQMTNTVIFAAVTNTPDILSPNISIDVAPSGVYSGDANAVLFKWTAIDDTSTAWRANPTSTNVQYRWKIDGGSYSSFSQSNHVWVGNLGAGNHVFYVSAVDAAGNIGERVYSLVPSGGQWNTAGTLTVTGNLTIGP